MRLFACSCCLSLMAGAVACSDAESTSAAGSGGTATGGSSAGGASTGGSPSGDCTDTAAQTGTFRFQYDVIQIFTPDNSKSYFLQSNWWYRYTSQSINYQGLSFTVSDPENTSVAANVGAPTGYPSFFIGSYQAHTTLGSNLPKAVTELTTIPTVFSTNSSELDSSNFNAAYDVWLTANGTPLSSSATSPGAGGAFLMVWLFKPASRQPAGGINNAPNVPAHAVEGVPGTWDVWYTGVRTDRAGYLAYVSTTALDSLAFDLNRFIQDAVTNNWVVTSSMYLSVIFAGSEIWGGGDGFQVKQFCARVN